MATTYSAVRSQTLRVDQQADAIQKEAEDLPALQSQVTAYRNKVEQLAAEGSSKEPGASRAADALIAATEVLETAYHVRVTDTRLDGPLPRPTPESVNNPLLAPPTPPPGPVPTPPSGLPFNRPVPVATPTATPVPGFYTAMQITDDPIAQVMDVYAGSFTIHGNYRALIGTLQDLPRQGALLRVISGGVCRDDHYGGKDRELTLAFRLYMLPPGDGT